MTSSVGHAIFEVSAGCISASASQLVPEEVAVIELFLRRRAQLGNFERSRKAAQIAERIRARLGATEKSDNERFLEEVMTEYRERGRYR